METLADIMANKSGYWLGPVVEVHQIGEYAFVEYQVKDHNRPRGEQLTDKHQFSIFIDGQSAGVGGETLDHALIIAIARKYDGVNSQAAYYFSKMIGMS